MVHAQTITTYLFVFLLSFSAKADWRLIFERAGFLGAYSGGFSYQWNERHATDLSLGSYSNDGVKYYQTNISYRYSRWSVPWENRNWIPIQIGVFTIRSLDKHNYFVKSPSEYPSDGYYDATAFRWGLLYGTALEFPESHFGIAYYIKILDNGIIALYNNSQMDLQYYISSGIGLHYIF